MTEKKTNEKKYKFTMDTFETIKNICKEKKIVDKRTIEQEADKTLNYQVITQVIEYMLEKGYLKEYKLNKRTVYEWIGE